MGAAGHRRGGKRSGGRLRDTVFSAKRPGSQQREHNSDVGAFHYADRIGAADRVRGAGEGEDAAGMVRLFARYLQDDRTGFEYR